MAKMLAMIANFDDIPDAALAPEAERPYDIPAHWKWVRLGNLITLLSGRDAALTRCNDQGRGIPYVMGASNFDEDGLRIERWIEEPEVVSPRGAVLVTVKGTVGKLHIQEDDKLNLSRQVMAMVPGPCLASTYLYHFISTHISRLESAAVGLIPGISRSDILGIAIPLPPLGEQERIVRRVEQANAKIDDAIERLRQHLEQAPNLRAKFIQAGVTGRLTPSRRGEQNLSVGSWRRTTVGELGTVVTGNTPPTKAKENYGDFLPFVKPADLNQGRRINLADSSLSETGAKLARVVPPGSVAMCCIGASITKAGLIDVEAATNQQINVLVPSTDHDSVFLFYLFESPQFKHEVIASSSSTTLPIINKGRFSKLEVEVPELLEQQEIARILDKTLGEFDQTVELIESTIAKLLLLRSHYVLSALAGN